MDAYDQARHDRFCAWLRETMIASGQLTPSKTEHVGDITHMSPRDVQAWRSKLIKMDALTPKVTKPRWLS